MGEEWGGAGRKGRARQRGQGGEMNGRGGSTRGGATL